MSNEQYCTYQSYSLPAQQNDDDYEDTDSVHSMRIKEFLLLNQQNTEIQRPKCSISPINTTDFISSDDNTSSSASKTADEFLLPTSTCTSSLLIPTPQFHLSTNSPAFIRQQQSQLYQPSTFIQSSTSAFQSPALYVPASSVCQDIPIQSTPNKYLAQKILNRSSRRQANNRVNFHSISDLAKSSSSSSSSSSSTSNSSQHQLSFNATSHESHINSSINDHSISSSFPSYQTNLTDYSTSPFYDKFKNISQISSNNKENNYLLPNPIDYFSNSFVSRENKRKPRTQITRQHRDVLERVYALNKYPDANEVEYLCHLLGFDENVIRIWFQNKRARDKLKRVH